MTYNLNCQYSDAVCQVKLNPIAATAEVYFWTGGPYTFRNVSRRAILKAIAEDATFKGLKSPGQWVNKVLLEA